MRGIQEFFDEYSADHRDHTNELIHWVCVPVIFFCVVGFIASIPSPPIPLIGHHLWVGLAILAVMLFYGSRSLTLMLGMGLWCAFCLFCATRIEHRAPWPLWAICSVLFVLAWIGQFIGHRIEGKRPSFLKDLQFLLIGPAWLMAKVLAKLSVPY